MGLGLGADHESGVGQLDDGLALAVGQSVGDRLRGGARASTTATAGLVELDASWAGPP